MKATIEDICLRNRTVYVLCDYEISGTPTIKVDVTFDTDQDIGLDELYDNNDNKLSEVLPLPLYEAIVAIVHRDFDPVRLASNHHLDHDGEAGRLFRRISRFDRDWDSIAKQKRMDEEGRST